MKNQIGKGIVVACIRGGALALALAAAPAFAADPAPAMPMAEDSATVHGGGTVTAVDKGSRIFTVKTDAGELRSFHAAPDVRAFDKLKTGDKIDIDFTESIALSMLPPGTKPSASEQAAAVKASSGMAGGVAKQMSISAKILSVDPAANTVTFKGPKGNHETVKVTDPANQAKLASLKPGQVMQFTYTEAVAVSITPKS